MKPTAPKGMLVLVLMLMLVLRLMHCQSVRLGWQMDELSPLLL